MGLPGPRPSTGPAGPVAGPAQEAGTQYPVALTRDAQGWSVVSPAGAQHAAGLIEGLSLADLIAEEFGLVPEPSRSARRAARSGGAESITDQPAAADPTDVRVAALERTVRQLEHALSARVATERAIGVLAERTGTGPRTAFERLRGEARNSGRPVAEVAREVMATLSADPVSGSDSAPADGVH